MLNRNKIIGKLSYALSFPKLIFLKLRGVHFLLFSGVRIFGFPKINTPRLVSLGKGVTLGRFVRLEGGISLADNVFVNEFTTLAGGVESPIVIGEQTSIGPGCFLITGDHDISAKAKINVENSDNGGKQGAIIIGKNCWLGAKVIVLKGVTIGDGAVVGAGSVVTKNLPADTVSVGNPAQVIKERGATSKTE